MCYEGREHEPSVPRVPTLVLSVMRSSFFPCVMARSAALLGAPVAVVVLGGLSGCPAGRSAGPSLHQDPPEVTTSVTAPAAADCPASALRLFVSFVRAEDFEGLLGLLSADLRMRYDADTLRMDHVEAGEALATDLAAIERALSDGGLVVSETEEEAVLPLGAGRAVRLVRESGGWRVRSLQ